MAGSIPELKIPSNFRTLFVTHYDGKLYYQILENFAWIDFGIWSEQNQLVFMGSDSIRFYSFEITNTTTSTTNAESTISTTSTETTDGCPQNGLLHVVKIFNYYFQAFECDNGSCVNSPAECSSDGGCPVDFPILVNLTEYWNLISLVW